MPRKPMGTHTEGESMSMPKQLAKRMKLAKKRIRKRENRRARQNSLATYSYQFDCFDPPDLPFGGVGGVKMSDVLSEFVSPEIDSTMDRTQLATLYSMGQAAWNIALEPEHRHDRMIDETIKERLDRAPPLEREGVREFLRNLVTRKLERFAGYQRPIFDNEQTPA
jgi:hypothetical protein